MGESKLKKYVAYILIILMMFCGIMSAYIILAHEADYVHIDAGDMNMAIIHITSMHDPFVQEREFWHFGAISISNHPDGLSLEAVQIGIRGRGSTTWVIGREKRPLRFRFMPHMPKDLLLNGTKHTDWILLSNHFDRSLMRNYAALYLGRLLDRLNHTPDCMFVHLYVNNVYMGVYQLVDERDVGTGRTEITLHIDPRISEYMIEWDERTRREPNQGVDWVLVGDTPFDIRFPSGRARTHAHANYVYDFLSRVSSSLRMGDFEAFSGLVCLDNFVDYYLAMEFTKDFDVGFSSFFMTIRGYGDTRRLMLGPLWDFDLAFGNYRIMAEEDWAIEGEYGYSPYGLTAALRNYWFGSAMAMPEFARLAFDRWQEISGNEVYATIRQVEAIGAYYSADFERNFTRHDILGRQVWQEPDYIISVLTHAGQVELLVDWMERRRQWMDTHLTESNWPLPFIGRGM